MSVQKHAVKISPNFLSTDLLTPQVPRRITFPSIGYFEPAHRSQTWGTDGTKYGGLGKLPFLGHVSNDRNIVISRSHRHFTCGVHDIEAPRQPYDVTSLTLSACRINDQLMPAPLVAIGSQHIEKKKQEEPWPEHVRHMYTSHMCRFEVFPRFDPYRTVFDGESNHTLHISCLFDIDPTFISNSVPAPRIIKQTLSPRATKALEELAESTYRATLYQTSFRDWSRWEEAGTRAQVHLYPPCMLGRQEPANEAAKLTKDEQKPPKDDCSASEDSEEPTMDQEDIPSRKESVHFARDETSCIDDEVCASTVVKPDCEMHPKDTQDHERHSEAAGTALPSQFSVLETKRPTVPPKPLLSRGERLPEGPLPSKRPEERIGVASYEAMLDRPLATSLNLPALSTGEQFKTSLQERSGNAVRTIEATLPSIKRSAMSSNGCHRKMRRPSIHGMRFKTEAHKKYHQLYSDLVPDLRQSTSIGKRHFFSGFHACVLR